MAMIHKCLSLKQLPRLTSIFIGLFQIQNNGYYRRYFQCPDGMLLLHFDHYSHTPDYHLNKNSIFQINSDLFTARNYRPYVIDPVFHHNEGVFDSLHTLEIKIPRVRTRSNRLFVSIESI